MWEWPPHSWGHQAWAPGGPSRVSVGADRGKDYSWVLAHALAGICRRLAKNDVGLVFEAILAVTAGAWAPFSLGPEQEPEASCSGSASLSITSSRCSTCRTKLSLAPHGPHLRVQTAHSPHLPLAFQPDLQTLQTWPGGRVGSKSPSR